MRRDGFREFIMSHGWTPWGAFSRRSFKPHFNEYLMFLIDETHPDYYVVRITAKDDHWGDLATEERRRMANKRRREFEMVDVGPAIRYVRCLTILLPETDDE